MDNYILYVKFLKETQTEIVNFEVTQRCYRGGVRAFHSETLLWNGQCFRSIKFAKNFFFNKIVISFSFTEVFTYQKR